MISINFSYDAEECHIISYNCVGSCDGSAVSLGKDELIPSHLSISNIIPTLNYKY